MKTFKIYRHPELGLQAVKVGFTWPGFLFGVIWMLICRLWIHAAVIFAIGVAITIIIPDQPQELGAILNFAVSMGIAYVVGMSGNQWRRDNLLKRGFQEVMAVEADNKDAALGIFHNECLKT